MGLQRSEVQILSPRPFLPFNARIAAPESGRSAASQCGFPRDEVGFSMVIRPESPWRRADLVQRLREDKIECRPIVAGNFADSESIRFYDHEIFGDLRNARHVSRQGLFVGNHPLDICPQIDLLARTMASCKAKSPDTAEA